MLLDPVLPDVVRQVPHPEVPGLSHHRSAARSAAKRTTTAGKTPQQHPAGGRPREGGERIAAVTSVEQEAKGPRRSGKGPLSSLTLLGRRSRLLRGGERRRGARSTAEGGDDDGPRASNREGKGPLSLRPGSSHSSKRAGDGFAFSTSFSRPLVVSVEREVGTRRVASDLARAISSLRLFLLCYSGSRRLLLGGAAPNPTLLLWRSRIN